MPDHPLVFIPGLPASNLQRSNGRRFFLQAFNDLLTVDRTELIDLLTGPDDISDVSVEADEPIRSALRFLHIDLLKQARTLYELLEPLGYDTSRENDEFTPFGWDWRKPVDEPAMLQRLLGRLRFHRQQTGRKAVVIVHSTGGLVLRALLHRHAEARGLVERVVAFGIPWAGTLKPLAFFTGQEGFAYISPEQAQQALSRSWAAFDLLPLPGAWPFAVASPLVVLRDGGGDTEIDLLTELGWLPPNHAAAMTPRAQRTLANRPDAQRRLPLPTGVEVLNVAGFGGATYRRAVLRRNGSALRVDALQQTVDHVALDDGDGTVPWRSASWLEADRTFHIPIGFYPGRNLAQLHSTLWTNPGGRDVLRHALRGDALPSFVQIAIDGDDVNLFGPTLRGFLVAQGGDGATLPGATLRRAGGPQIPFTASDGPRHGFALATATLPKTQDRRFFRFTLSCDFTGATEPEERTFLLPTSRA